MKVRPSVKPMCEKCKIIKRRFIKFYFLIALIITTLKKRLVTANMRLRINLF